MSRAIQLRGDTAANWTSANPILAQREPGIELDTFRWKFGDGITPWNSLSYKADGGVFTALSLDAVSDPSTPSSGLLVYAKEVAGKIVPKIVGPSGLDTPLQSAIYQNGMSIASPGTTTAFSYFGMGAFTTVGTVSHPTLNANTLRESTRRGICTSATTANSAADIRLSTTVCWRGNGAGLGGFFANFRFGISSTVATQRAIVGLASTTSAIGTSQEPSALVSWIGVGRDAADSNLQLMSNNTAGTADKIDLGSDFPAVSANAIFELTLFAAPNAAGINYRVKRLDAGGLAEGYIDSAKIPTPTTFLAPRFYVNNGGAAASVVMEMYRYYLETDY